MRSKINLIPFLSYLALSNIMTSKSTGYMSLKIIGNGTIRLIAYEFLFVFHCNYGRTLYRFYRATRMHSADYAVARCLSVYLSVCPYVSLSHAGMLPKRLHIFSKYFHRRVAPPFYFFHTDRDDNIPTGTP